jgi:signal transduction histidine kinase
MAGRFGLAGWAAAIPGVFVLTAAGVVVTVMFGAMRRFASPLGAVMDAADRVAEGDYGVRVQEYGPPPMRALTHSFNTMTERLQNADRLRRDLMADVAHELRTPLSVLQGRLEGLLDGVYPRDDPQISQLLDETHVLSRFDRRPAHAGAVRRWRAAVAKGTDRRGRSGAGRRAQYADRSHSQVSGVARDRAYLHFAAAA